MRFDPSSPAFQRWLAVTAENAKARGQGGIGSVEEKHGIITVTFTNGASTLKRVSDFYVSEPPSST